MWMMVEGIPPVSAFQDHTISVFVLSSTMFPTIFLPMVDDALPFFPMIPPMFLMVFQCFQACAPTLGFSGAIRFPTLNAVGTGWPALLRVQCAISAGPSYPRGKVETGMPLLGKSPMIRRVNGGIDYKWRIFHRKQARIG